MTSDDLFVGFVKTDTLYTGETVTLRLVETGSMETSCCACAYTLRCSSAKVYSSGSRCSIAPNPGCITTHWQLVTTSPNGGDI